MFEQMNISSPRGPLYDPEAVQPMRDELTYVGFEELLTPGQVDDAVANTKGTMLVMINSVCGCAAGSARPGVAEALQHRVIPGRLVTVFAGQDRDAVDRMRAHISQPPSSPSMALFIDGKLEVFIPRYEIEGRSAGQLSDLLTRVFDEFCSKEGPSIPKEKYDELVHAKMCGSHIPKYSGVN